MLFNKLMLIRVKQLMICLQNDCEVLYSERFSEKTETVTYYSSYS